MFELRRSSVVAHDAATRPYPIAGRSMFPLCRPLHVKVAPTEYWQVGDIAVYLAPRGRHLMVHRVVAVEPHQVITRGDTNAYLDQPVPRTALLGRVTGVGLGAVTIPLPASGPLALAQRRAGLTWGRAAPHLRRWLGRLRRRTKV